MLTSNKKKIIIVRCNTLATKVFPTFPTIVNDRHEPPPPVHKMANVHNNDHKHKSAQRNSRTDGMTNFLSNHSCVGPRTCDWMQNVDNRINV